MTTTSLPDDLRHIAPFLQRAKEMEKADPVISYWCTFHAMQAVIANGMPTTPESHRILFGVMDRLEAMKKTIAENNAVSNSEAAAAYVENFALKIFNSADNEDRSGKAKKTTAMRFLAASTFLSVLSSVCSPTAPPDPAIADKIKYAKWKATSISKALKAGLTPTPGPAGSELNEDGTDAAGLASLDAPGIEGVPERETQEAMEGAVTSTDEVFMTDEGPPLSANSGALGWSLAPEPAFADVLSTIPAAVPSPPAAFQIAIGPSLPAAPHSSPRFDRLYASSPPAAPTAVFAAQAPAVPPPQLYDPSTSNDSALDPTVIAAVQKHAKWAISALNYEDVETARKELRLALEKLG